uniref:Alpha N-terminal protein methyltransferase 1 n=1 Tax=Strombidium rassoulzadegani TaxID=1082188 RepID=A0A7S3CSS5_9SPIT|mmetsp:Transcript_6610/g.11141  ORF Transcript_6610/g.11141 Transcript_6610/m.11141 type:complete len:173 (+) Transcript_6610:286-804(+)
MEGGEQGKKARAFDVGSGIGRISKDLLFDYFEEVDLLDQSPVQIEEARRNVPNGSRFYTGGFQDFEFEEGRAYDVIWLQWFLMYLKDDDLVEMLRRCGDKAEYLVVKENTFDLITSLEDQKVDHDDNSVVRTIEEFKQCFERADLEILAEEMQPDWPKELFPVAMFLLKKRE